MQDIQTEFGGAPPIGLDEYYAGGLYVPAGTSGVPSSGTISMDNLRGKTKTTPITVTVSPSSRVEGEFFIIQFTSPVFQYSTLYWKLTNYTNLQDSDFNATTGVVSYESEGGSYPNDAFRPITDSEFEGTGTFKVSVYSDAARTLLVGESSLLTVTDAFTVGTITLSRSEIYRYANLNPAFRSSLITLNASGLGGATIYYEVFTSSGTLTSADIDAPTSLTGTVTATATKVELVVRATEWNPAAPISTDKNVQVRFRLQNSTGILLGTSGSITLIRSPQISFSPFSPTTIREGQTTTVTAASSYIPIANPAAVSVFFTTDGTATLSGDFLNFSVNTGEILFTSNTPSLSLTAKIDELSDANETLRLIMRKTSTSGTAFWIVGDNPPSNPPLTIGGPAIIDSVSASIGAVQITSISSYPLSRTFTVRFRNGTGSFNTSNITSPSTVTVAANQTSSNTLQMLNNPGGNNAAHSIQYLFESPGYFPYSPPVANETFTWPVYALEIAAIGTNAEGVPVTVTARITSTPTYGTSRVFQFQYRTRTPGTTAWGDWISLNTVTVGESLTSSLTTTIFSGTTFARIDVQGRVVLAGQELRESNIILNRWI
jgi:hypothetical protein